MSKVGITSIERSYKPETWYPLSDFVGLVENVRDHLSETDKSTFNLGKGTITDDERWKWDFKGMNPEDVFSGTSRQNAQYKVGEFSVIETSPGFLQLQMSLWERDARIREIWSEFYRGRLQGILDLTGSKGNVEMKYRPPDDGKDTVYTIMWIISE